MKIIFDRHTQWYYAEKPFGALECGITYGPRKRDHQFIPFVNIAPVIIYTVKDSSWKVLYEGPDKDAAALAKKQHDETPLPEGTSTRRNANISESKPSLQSDQFQIVRLVDDKRLSIRGGVDTTNRVLFLVGEKGGHRGDVEVIDEHTDAQILVTCYAQSNLESRRELAVLMSEGQKVTFRVYGKGKGPDKTDIIVEEMFVQYIWDGTEIERVEYRKAEWDFCYVIQR
jgi:hypothetical protein